MEKVIKIGDKDVRVSNNAAWAMEYKEQFGTDIMPAIMPLISTVIEGLAVVISEANEDGTISANSIADAVTGRTTEILLPLYNSDFTDLGINVVWAMAKAADESIEPPKQWVRQFDTFPVDEIIPEVYGMLVKGMVSVKNLQRLKNLAPTLKKLQPLTSTILSSEGSSEG